MVHLPYLQPFIDVNKRTYIEAPLGVYELRRTDLLADLFVWAYERSATRYRIVRDAVVQPDPIRLRHRNALSLCVQDTVRYRDREPGYFTNDILDNLGVDVVDREAFMSLAKSTLTELHDGVIARYGLRRSEFHAWKAARSTR